MSKRKNPKNRWPRKGTSNHSMVENTLEVIQAPKGERVLLKEVPAMVDDEVVGTTLIYDDRSVDVIYNNNISIEAKEKIDKVTAQYKQLLLYTTRSKE